MVWLPLWNVRPSLFQNTILSLSSQEWIILLPRVVLGKAILRTLMVDYELSLVSWIEWNHITFLTIHLLWVLPIYDLLIKHICWFGSFKRAFGFLWLTQNRLLMLDPTRDTFPEQFFRLEQVWLLLFQSLNLFIKFPLDL